MEIKLTKDTLIEGKIVESGRTITIVEAKDDEAINKIMKDMKKSFDATDDGKAQTLQLFKGLIFSENEKAKKFVKDLDTFTTNWVEENINEA